MSEKLTETKIKALVPPASGQVEYPDAEVPGLRVRMGTSGTKTFILRKRTSGKLINATLGRYHPTRFNLNDARKKARTLVSDLEASGGVLPKQKVPSSALTLRAMAPNYVAYCRDDKRNKGWAETERLFERHILPALGDRLADTITRGDITRMLDCIENASAARASFAALSAFYTWALPRLDKLPANPARNAGKPSSAKARDRVLTEAELRALWKAIDAEPFPWRAGMKLLILTGTRRDEVFTADRAEFDKKDRLWTIPAARSKNGVEHLVPLSDDVLAVLETVPVIGESEKLFPAARGGKGSASGYSKLAARLRAAVQKEIGAPVPLWRFHDIRRTAATGMQRLGIRLEVTEAILGHVSGSRAGIVGIYQRHNWLDEKRAALDAWACEVARIVEARK